MCTSAIRARMCNTQVEQWIERERVTMQKEREEKEQSILSQKLNSLGMCLQSIYLENIHKCVHILLVPFSTN
jgi:hypothetical protein